MCLVGDNVFIHESAHVSSDAIIGANTKIWINTQIRENVVIGSDCNLAKDTYIDIGVTIGDRCKIQNSVSVYAGVTIEDDVFIGPCVTFTNDMRPRAFIRGWKITPTTIKKGASLGANSTVVCGVTIGEYAMVAAGSVVTKDVPSYALVMGNPARVKYYVDRDGNKVR